MDQEPMTLDFGGIWQSQPITEVQISPEDIRERVAKSEATTRRGFQLFAVSAVLHILIHIGRQFMAQGEFSGPVGVLELTTLLILLAYWPYQYAWKTHWPMSILPETRATPGLDFYRRQLELRRNFYAGDGAA